MTGATGADPLLSGTRLRRYFGATAALDGAEFALSAGEVVAVTGPSGSGKSTLLHCLAGILTLDGGAVRYRGRELSALPDAERSRIRREEFGFVFQFGQLVPELTCVENVALSQRLAGVGRRGAEASARAWLARLGVDDVRDERPARVSGGQRQRVAVARALVGGPRVVFADEPTGALDALHGERVMELLTDAARGSGAAVVLVTHDVRVAAHADREVVVRDGQAADATGIAGAT